MIDYEKVKSIVRKHKGALTRAKNSGDPHKVLAAAQAALADFDKHGYPDRWHLWQCAEREAKRDIALT